MSSTCLVTGFTGYIALHIVKQLLQKGYKVIGTVRSSAKGDHYSKLFDNKNFSYEIVANIADKTAFNEVFEKHPEIEYVYHVASPFTFDVTDFEKELIIPAINGTVGILETAKAKGPNVKRIVVTTSYASHINPVEHYGHKETVVTEDDISSLSYEDAKKDVVSAYWGSKKFALEAAWNFLEQEKPNFELVTISPSFVYGPQAFPEFSGSLPVSVATIKSVLDLKKGDDLPNDGAGLFIDVRDVVDAHINSMEFPEAANKKFLLTNGKFNQKLLANIIGKNFPNLDLPTFPQENQEDLDCAWSDNSFSVKTLKLNPISIEKSMVDSVNQFLQAAK